MVKFTVEFYEKTDGNYPAEECIRSKLENGNRNPSLNLLKRLADGMGMTLKLEFIPKKQSR